LLACSKLPLTWFIDFFARRSTQAGSRRLTSSSAGPADAVDLDVQGLEAGEVVLGVQGRGRCGGSGGAMSHLILRLKLDAYRICI
jgi:hypothetical protein